MEIVKSSNKKEKEKKGNLDGVPEHTLSLDLVLVDQILDF